MIMVFDRDNSRLLLNLFMYVELHSSLVVHLPIRLRACSPVSTKSKTAHDLVPANSIHTTSGKRH